ncbi:hypothetical protein ASE16_06625 [Leifsonia sp. Root227]|nr:hypothetical protein ASE16_06625 [Leifsonia sp. Root227]
MSPEPLSPAAVIFGARVRNVRVELGLSQENVADLAQMHVTNYGKIERGVANPSLVTILRIASVFGVDVAALTAGLNGDHLPAAYSVLPAAEYLRSRHGNSLLGP